MKISVRNVCSDFNGYRAARVKSLFNAESGCNFDIDADLPIEGSDWKIGVIVGPSGSGKTSIGRKVWGDGAMYDPVWPKDSPIVEAISPGGDFDSVTGALSAVGLGTVPAWLRSFHVLSNGEKFRANLARLISEAPARAVVDEFSSVVDRQIAKFGALAFAKAWRRTKGQVILLSCHYDVLDWISPDWVFDTSKSSFSGRWLRRRPEFDLEVWATDWRYWPLFEPHHYLKLPRMIAAKCYVGTVDGELVCHVGVGTANCGGVAEARACRLVVMPEWQGAGVGTRFLDQVCQWQAEGHPEARLPGRKVTTMFHTSHPGLAAALRRNPRWRMVSAKLFGVSKRKSASSMLVSSRRSVTNTGAEAIACGYSGHLRAVQGYRYVGDLG